VALIGGCAGTGAVQAGAKGLSTAGATRSIRVIAAENFWGSIAGQLGGCYVHVLSIIDSPNADPHDYEPTAADGRAIARTARTRTAGTTPKT